MRRAIMDVRPQYRDFQHRTSERAFADLLFRADPAFPGISPGDFKVLPTSTSEWSLKDIYAACHILLYSSGCGQTVNEKAFIKRILRMACKRARELDNLDAEAEVYLCGALLLRTQTCAPDLFVRILQLPCRFGLRELSYYHPKLLAATGIVAIRAN